MQLFRISLLVLSMGMMTTTLSAQTDEQKKMEEAWGKYMTPGEEHKELAKGVGSWSEVITMWWDPKSPPKEYKASCENTMILGGRYQQSVHKGEMDGMPFEGTAVTGFDNALKKYVSTWVDNMGTGIMYSEGVYDPKSKSILFTGTMVDAMTGKKIPFRETMTFVDDNTHIMEMFITQDGKEMKTMNIKFTRNH